MHFEELQCMLSEISKGSMELTYDRKSEATEVDDSRRQLFTQKPRTMQNIPPTQVALKEHIKRTCYQWRDVTELKYFATLGVLQQVFSL